MKKPTQQKKRTPVRLPLLWRFASWLCVLILAPVFFVAFVKMQKVPLFPVAGQSTDPYFFASMLTLVVSLLLLALIMYILTGIYRKQTAAEIAKELGRDILHDGAEAAAVTLLDALVGGGGDSQSSQSSSRDQVSGGGGQSGGGGASGGF